MTSNLIALRIFGSIFILAHVGLLVIGTSLYFAAQSNRTIGNKTPRGKIVLLGAFALNTIAYSWDSEPSLVSSD